MDKRVGIAGVVVVMLALVVAKGCGNSEPDYERGTSPDVPKNWTNERFQLEVKNIQDNPSLGPREKAELIDRIKKESGRGAQ